MRERITAVFVVVAVVMVGLAVLLRAVTLDSFMQEHQAEHQHHMLHVLATTVEQRIELGRPVDEAFLAGVVGAEYRMRWTEPGQRPIVVEGEEFAKGDPQAAVSGNVGSGELVLEESSVLVDRMVAANLGDGILLGGLVALLAGLIGLGFAWFLSRPFQQLAGAAAALGRGRFELDLPVSRMPEVVAISAALRGSAQDLQQRLTRERDFAEHTSHVLRTPLTGLRLEVEDLAARSDLPEDARQAAGRAVGRVEVMDAVAGELVRLARGGVLVEGAEIPLSDLVAQARDRWGDTFARAGRKLEFSISGDQATTYTPGPVEQLLDLILGDLVSTSATAAAQVSLTVGAEGDLRIRTVCPGSAAGVSASTAARASGLVTALGGRFAAAGKGYDVLLPRR